MIAAGWRGSKKRTARLRYIPSVWLVLPAWTEAAETVKRQVQKWWPEADCTVRPYPALSMPD
jgi:hypothetical protein